MSVEPETRRLLAAAAAIAGILWTAVSPAAAFIYVGGWMALAMTGLAVTAISSRSS